MRIYKIKDELKPDGRWYLGAVCDEKGNPLIPDNFIGGVLFEAESPICISLRDVGHPLEFTFASYSVPVVTGKVVEIFRDIASDDFQLVPVQIGGVEGEYYVLNAIKRLICLNEERSLFTKWKESDGRPEKTGGYKMVARLVLSLSGLSEAQLFRVKGWEVPLLGGERLVRALRDEGTRGLEFELIEVV